MSSKPASDFEASWPAVAQDLRRLLARRGVDSYTTDDLIQETAFKILTRWDRLDHERPLFPFAATVALNLMKDGFRRSGREFLCDEQPNIPSGDVESEGLARLELTRVSKAIRGLPAAQREVLLATVTEPLAREDEAAIDSVPERSVTRSTAATKMLRMRARRRLVTMLEAAGLSIAGFRLRVHQWLGDSPQAAVALIGASTVVVSSLAFPIEDVQPRSEVSFATRAPVPAHDSISLASGNLAAKGTNELSEPDTPLAVMPAETDGLVPVSEKENEPDASVEAGAQIDPSDDSSLGADAGVASAWVQRDEGENYSACVAAALGVAEADSCGAAEGQDP